MWRPRCSSAAVAFSLKPGNSSSSLLVCCSTQALNNTSIRALSLGTLPRLEQSPTVNLLEQEAALIEDASRDHIPVDPARIKRLLHASAEVKNLELINKTHELITKLRPTDDHLHISLISAYAEVEQPQEALEVFTHMQQSGMRTKNRSHVALLKAFVDDPEKARQVLHMMKAKKLRPNLHTFGAMINAHVKAGQLQEAEEVLIYMKSRQVFPSAAVYTPLIDGHLKQGNKDQALQFLNEMIGRGIKPNLITQTIVLNAHAKADPDKARELLHQLKQKGMALDEVAYVQVINGLVKKKRLDEAVALLREAEKDALKLSAVIYTPFIKGYFGLQTEEGAKKAFAFIEEARQRDIAFDCHLYSGVVMGLTVNNKPKEEVSEWIDEMYEKASYPSLREYAYLLNFFCTRKDKDNAMHVFRNVVKTGIVLDDSIFVPLLNFANGGEQKDEAVLSEIEQVKARTEEERDQKRQKHIEQLKARKMKGVKKRMASKALISAAWERRIQQEVEDQQNAYKKWRAAFEEHIIQPLREDEEQLELRKEYKARGMWPPPEPPKPKVNQKLLARRKMIEERHKKREARQAEWEKIREDKLKAQDQEILGKLSKKDRALVLAAREEEAAAKAAALRKKDDWDEEPTPVVSAKKEKKEEEGPKGKKKKKKAEEPAAGGEGGGGGGKGKK